MTLKDKLSADAGFQYVIDQLELMSAPGRRCLLQQEWSTDAHALEAEYGRTDRIAALLGDHPHRAITVIRHQLMQLHDLQGTLQNLARRTTLDEIELFEVKHLAYLCAETTKAAASADIADITALPDVADLFRLLDPDATGLPHFYVYDSYHPELGPLRRQLKAKQTLLDGATNATPDERAALQREVNDLYEQQQHIAQQVMQQLSQQLWPHQERLQQAFDRMAYTDLLLAKATLATQQQLCRPRLDGGDATHLSGLWNPRLRHRNEQQHLRYQPIDISIHSGVCLITGANMAGKTVLLKSVGIAQLMAQFGFFVPAAKAQMQLFDDVAYSIGDEQNEMNGLSSFASEIIKISQTVERAATERLLILIDEPARTTNPVEGKAIVQAVATHLDQRPSATLITTHYSQLGLSCRRLRVRGFVEQMADVALTPANINRFMDYSLLEDSSDEVPHEALRIATILGCNPQLIQTAREKIASSVEH